MSNKNTNKKTIKGISVVLVIMWFNLSQLMEKKRTLPTMSIFTKSRESLAELEKSTMKMLSAATGYTYSAK